MLAKKLADLSKNKFLSFLIEGFVINLTVMKKYPVKSKDISIHYDLKKLPKLTSKIKYFNLSSYLSNKAKELKLLICYFFSFLYNNNFSKQFIIPFKSVICILTIKNVHIFYFYRDISTAVIKGFYE